MTDNPLNDFSDNQTNSIINQTGFTSPPPFYTKRPKPNSLQMTTFELFPKRKQFHQPKTNHRTSTLHSSLEEHLILPIYSNVNTTPNDIIVDNTPVNDDTDSPIEVYSETNYPFPPPSF